MKTLTQTDERYPYQLTRWLRRREDLDKVVGQFTLHNCEDRAVIVNNEKGWCVYTDGKDRIVETYYPKRGNETP